MSGSPRPTASRVTLCAGGPMLVRGAVEVETEDGVTHRSDRPISAICRCGASARTPWCDGTHKLLGQRAAGSA